MEPIDDSLLATPLSDAPIPIPKQYRAPGWAGWLLGAVLGAIACLWAFPAVRYTLGAQVDFAVASENFAWLTSLDQNRKAQEAARLDTVSSSNLDDYLLQVGRATALVGAGTQNSRIGGLASHAHNSDIRDHTLARLASVARSFPAAPGAYAHLARYLMLQRIKIHRESVRPPGGGRDRSDSPAAAPPAEADLRIMLWALNTGQHRDPANGFWEAMRAATFCAVGDDEAAMASLDRASRATHWDAYIYEEVLGQWRLYSAAYGDHGAMQQVGPLSLVAFPYLHELRRLAEVIRMKAEAMADGGQEERALRTLRALARLGIVLRDEASWALEALQGTDIFFIACSDVDTPRVTGAIQRVDEWEPHAKRYLQMLKRRHERQVPFLRAEVERSCALVQKVNFARYDASYSGVPPGIPLAPLFGSWMAGVCLIQQMLTMVAVTVAAAISYRLLIRRGRRPFRLRLVLLAAGIAIAILAPTFLIAEPRPFPGAMLFIACACLLLIAMELFYRARRERAEQDTRWRPEQDPRDEALAPFARSMRDASERCGAVASLLLTLLGTAPSLLLIYVNQTFLQDLHPVAVLLNGLAGIPRSVGAREAAVMAALATATPLLLPLLFAVWALFRGASPVASALLGLRRGALPAIVCMVTGYTGILYQTLILDAEASRAIAKAAQNDRQWVLTHGQEAPF